MREPGIPVPCVLPCKEADLMATSEVFSAVRGGVRGSGRLARWKTMSSLRDADDGFALVQVRRSEKPIRWPETRIVRAWLPDDDCRWSRNMGVFPLRHNRDLKLR